MNRNAAFIYAAGVIGSVFLIRGAKWGRSIVRMLALLMVIACFVQILCLRMDAVWRSWRGIVADLGHVSAAQQSSNGSPKKRQGNKPCH